jgi:hypothetical protein
MGSAVFSGLECRQAARLEGHRRQLGQPDRIIQRPFRSAQPGAILMVALEQAKRLIKTELMRLLFQCP